MKWWHYVLGAAAARAILMWFGAIPGYIATGIFVGGVAAYWIRRLYFRRKERRQQEVEECQS